MTFELKQTETLEMTFEVKQTVTLEMTSEVKRTVTLEMTERMDPSGCNITTTRAYMRHHLHKSALMSPSAPYYKLMA